MFSFANFLDEFDKRMGKQNEIFPFINEGSRISFLQPIEIAYFLRVGPNKVIDFFKDYCKIQPSTTLVQDIYLDRSDGLMFKNSSSLRIRSYPEFNSNQIDIIWLGWGFPNAIKEQRIDSVVVCSINKSDFSTFNYILEYYKTLGFIEKCTLLKKRTSFSVKPSKYKNLRPKANESLPINLQFFNNQIEFNIFESHGLRIMVDEFIPISENYDSILEIEFDRKYLNDALKIQDCFLKRFQDNVEEKRKNKIHYILSTNSINSNEFRTSKVILNKLQVSSDKANSKDFQSPWSKSLPEFIFPSINYIIKKEWRKEAMPRYGKVKVISPGRLHFGVFNFEKIRVGVPGGGGIGVSTSAAKNIITVQITKQRKSPIKLIPQVEHLLKLFSTLVNYDWRRIDIKIVEQITHKHSGLGSNISLNIGVLFALNKLFDEPFSIDELCKINMHNYIEGYNKSMVALGMDSGLGSPSILLGGLTWVNEDGEFCGNLPLLEHYCLLAIPNKQRKKSHPNNENLDISKIDEISKGKLKEFIPNTFWKAFQSKNPKKVFEVCREFNSIWCNHFMKSIYGERFLKKFEIFSEKLNAIYAGMSSEGPSLFMIFENQDDLNQAMLKTTKNPELKHFKIISGKIGEKLHYDAK
ncbi:MAG: hypothetical protein KF746_24915 [Chitinophagaceae bacterium]|nr:hypothetical protein [Chitinophagaceae bacterium]